MKEIHDALRQNFIGQACMLGMRAVKDETQEQITKFYRDTEYCFALTPDFSLRFKERTEDMELMLDFLNRQKPAYDLFEQSESLSACGVDDYRKLSEMNDVVLAATLKRNNELHFVTWVYTYNRTGVAMGHYFGTDYENCKQEFAVRAGLIAENKLFQPDELTVIHEACLNKLVNDKALDYDKEKALQSLVEKLELLNPQLMQKDEVFAEEAETDISQEV